MSDSDLFDTWRHHYAKKCVAWEDRSLNYEKGKLEYTYETMQREIDVGLSLKSECDNLMREVLQEDNFSKQFFQSIQNDITKTLNRLNKLRDGPGNLLYRAFSAFRGVAICIAFLTNSCTRLSSSPEYPKSREKLC